MTNNELLQLWIDYFKKEAHKKGSHFLQKELSYKSGVAESYITSLLYNRINLGEKVLDKIVKGLGISKAQFYAGPPPQQIKSLEDYKNGEYIPGIGTVTEYDPTDTIPLLTDIPAGHWKDWNNSYPVGFGEGKVARYDLKGKHIFAIRVEGESMLPDLEPGDILILDPEKAFTNVKGGIGIVKCNEGFQIRHVYLRGDNYLLEPSNKAYEPEIVPVTGATIFKVVEWRPKREGKF